MWRHPVRNHRQWRTLFFRKKRADNLFSKKKVGGDFFRDKRGWRLWIENGGRNYLGMNWSGQFCPFPLMWNIWWRNYQNILNSLCCPHPNVFLFSCWYFSRFLYFFLLKKVEKDFFDGMTFFHWKLGGGAKNRTGEIQWNPVLCIRRIHALDRVWLYSIFPIGRIIISYANQKYYNIPRCLRFRLYTLQLGQKRKTTLEC